MLINHIWIWTRDMQEFLEEMEILLECKASNSFIIQRGSDTSK